MELACEAIKKDIIKEQKRAQAEDEAIIEVEALKKTIKYKPRTEKHKKCTLACISFSMDEITSRVAVIEELLSVIKKQRTNKIPNGK